VVKDAITNYKLARSPVTSCCQWLWASR